jgi:hypothetical protein
MAPLKTDYIILCPPLLFGSTLPYRSFDPRLHSFPCCRSAISFAQRATTGDCLAFTCQLAPWTHLHSSLLVLWDTYGKYLPLQGHARLAVRILRFVYGEPLGPPAKSLHFSQSLLSPSVHFFMAPSVSFSKISNNYKLIPAA